METQIDLLTDALVAFTEGDSDAPEQAARFLKSIAHRDRLKLLCALLEGEQSVASIEAQVGASQSAVSQYLARFKAEGLVTARRDGRQIYYSISDPTVQSLIELLYARFCAKE
ncbi:MAG: metalloregulator ArsR/SmtB family transcription factor [Pseudomonadota bacterium]|nr:metalloregulator ArsR/SmtB family transcription factor [Pseudomonadota bacterium]